jgi:hypothetical protein
MCILLRERIDMTDFNPKDFTAEELDGFNLVGVLTPKTKKGKQRVKQHGSTGKVMRVVDSIIASDERGPFFLVAAGDIESRWINFTDKDFDLEIKPWADMPITAKGE